MHHVIIGNGIAGITAARTLRKRSNDKITVISGETDYFYSRTALMYIYMGHMRYQDTKPYEDWFWEKNNIELKRAWVNAIQSENKQIVFEDGSAMPYDTLLIATGSKSNMFSWPGNNLQGVQSLYSLQDLDLLEQNTKHGINRAVIVGGGLIGIELAEMLHARKFSVTMLVRESNYWDNVLPQQEATLISNHIRAHEIDLRLGAELKEIIGDENGRVKTVITKNNESIACQLVGITVGVSPNISLLKDSEIKTDRGVVINRYFQTNIPDVFAAGDCAQFQEPLHDRKPVEQLWYTGKIQGETAALNMLGFKITYNPGHWYNSAKFMDIEYQTYGTVLPQLRQGESEFYWEHPDGKKSLHFIYNTKDRKFIGINNFGIRLRHELFNLWLKESRSIDYVLEHLKPANFDPELFSTYETQIIKKWNAENPNYKLELRSRKSLNKIIFG
ncbi:MAG TPA: FAD-dependent oxidoreductase [Chitinophagales bacterium]|nr:FAD-dependent oxidoreductase [Chitinophagales bacterium]